MPLHPGFDTARDLYEKFQRDASRLNAEVTPDAFFNFVITAWALCDWATKDPALSVAAHIQVGQLRATPWLQICRDIANGSKHFKVSTYSPQTGQTAAINGFGVGRYGVGAFGVGEWSILIEHDATSYDALRVADEVTNLWKAFFDTHREKSDIPEIG